MEHPPNPDNLQLGHRFNSEDPEIRIQDGGQASPFIYLFIFLFLSMTCTHATTLFVTDVFVGMV